MVRSGLITLGVGLVILWLAGLGSPWVPGWLAWLQGLAALLSFGAAATSGAHLDVAADKAMMLSTYLIILWAITFTVPTPQWARWVTLAFAVAFFALGAAAMRTEARLERDQELTESIEEDQHRRAA